VSVLLQRDGMGDVVVITASRSVAAWAKGAAHHRGERGTSLGLTPVVLLLSKDRAAALLDPARPELAIFAVWAGCRGHGPTARGVAKRALELTEALPAPFAGRPGACDPGHVEPAAPGLAQGDGDGCR
jgi:hypothetical protein